MLVDSGYQSPPGEPRSYDDVLESAREELESSRFSDAETYLKAMRQHYSARLSDTDLLAAAREENGDLVPRVAPEVFAGGFHGYETEPTPALYGALRESATPILLLLAGQSKGAEHAAEVEAFRQALPDADVRVFPESGHNVLLDAPDEAIPAIADWLTEHAK